MIFTALGLLVLAAAFLIAGIAKSSVAFLMLSLVTTMAAGAALAIAYSIARRSGVIADTGSAAGPAGGVGAPPPGAVVMYVPVDQLPAMSPANAMKVGAAPSTGNGSAVSGAAAPPIAAYESMTADQVCKLVASGALNEVQLQAVRDYEAAHAGRKTILERIDRTLYRT